jgi:hypothetical protein
MRTQAENARRHAVALRQCALFAADCGEHIAKAMTEAADFLDELAKSEPAERSGGLPGKR